MLTTGMVSSSSNPDTFVDLSHPLDQRTRVYPGDPPFSCTPHLTVPNDGCSVHALALSSHAGTHIDAPSHFFDRLPTIDQLPISTFIRPAVVLDLSHKRSREPISWSDMSALIDASASEHQRRGQVGLEPGTAVLVFTGWSRFWGMEQYFDHPWIEREAAERLVAMGVTAFGSDTMSPDQMPRAKSGVGGEGLPETGFGVHEVVLGVGGIIAENLTNLDKLKDMQDGLGAQEGAIMVSLVPLRIAGCDGSPVRAFAWKK